MGSIKIRLQPRIVGDFARFGKTAGYQARLLARLIAAAFGGLTAGRAAGDFRTSHVLLIK